MTAVLNPLIRATTYRRAVFLLLGGVLVLPYVLLGVVAYRLLQDPAAPRGAAVAVTVVGVVVAAIPPLLSVCRTLESAAARSLLDVELPVPAAGERIDWETRLRAAVWFGLHLIVGGGVGLGLITVVPVGLVLIVRESGIRLATLPDQPFGPIEAHHSIGLALISLLVLAAYGYVVAGLGVAARSIAPALLGPSPRERIAVLEARAERLAERDRLARELHDSIGHALTVTTLQAGAAREVLDSDVEFARRALGAIEETGRGAMEELDYVLGLLRERDQGRAQTSPNAADRVPRRTLRDLDRLVTETCAAGVPVMAEIGEHVRELPPVVSREGYRIVQEGLTNATRYGAGAVTLRVATLGAALMIELVNRATNAHAGLRAGGGHGLDGMRERVRLLGGSMSAGLDGDVWRVSVRLPAPAADAS
ncbi:MAG TPA: histidine kinase [Rugosimonospora sp.]